MSFKKSDKKNKKPSSRNTLSISPPSASSAAIASGGQVPTTQNSSAMPDGTRAKLLELFGQIEQQFEVMHMENTARECCQLKT